MKSRESRKIDHIKYALHLEDGPCATGFSDIQVFHRALPQADRRDIDLSTALPGIGTLAQPLVINAITGGAEAVKAINGELAAVALIQAQALQIHLNSAQELAMEEGDRDFSHWLEQIEAVCARSEVPVIVKETGCGMAREDARRLLDCGVSILDTGGAGGTNFPAIEGCRYPEGNRELSQWGIPSALSLLEVVEARGWQKGIIASGGIRTALDVFKARMLGANAVGMAGNILRLVQAGGTQEAIDWIRKLLEAVKDFYTLTGCTREDELRQVRYYFTGDLAAAVRSFPYGENEFN